MKPKGRAKIVIGEGSQKMGVVNIHQKEKQFELGTFNSR